MRPPAGVLRIAWLVPGSHRQSLPATGRPDRRRPHRQIRPGLSSYRWLKLPHDLTINSTDRRPSLSASGMLYNAPEAVAGSRPLPAATAPLVRSFCSIGTILPPRPAQRPGRRAQRPSRRARLRATASAARSVLDGREHDGMISRVGGHSAAHQTNVKKSANRQFKSVLMLRHTTMTTGSCSNSADGRGLAVQTMAKIKFPKRA